MNSRGRRGFSLVELIAIVLILALLVGIVLALIPRHRGEPMQLSDSTQVRGIYQGMVLWAQNNKDVYPLPSLADLKNETVADQGAAKDTTANIISIMMYNGFFSPELCVSPNEVSTRIKVFGQYAYSNPSTAVKPDMALWDPAFSTDFSGGKTGGFSYAHMMPEGARLKDRKSTGDASRAVIGNRGPEIKGFGAGSKGQRIYVGAGDSNTYRIHKSKAGWAGNVAYNDGHLTFESRWDPESSTYKDSSGKEWNDCLFFDETDDPSHRNNFLGNFIKAGSTKDEFMPTWD